MNWNSQTLVEIISRKVTGEFESNDGVLVDYRNSKRDIAVGKDSKGNVVLLLPQQESLYFKTDFAEFRPSTHAISVHDGSVINDVAVLTCKVNLNDQSVIEAAAAIFLGLIDLQDKYGHCGDAIWHMKKMFETGLQGSPTDAAIYGLFGELLFIKLHDDYTPPLSAWHSNVASKYDFSTENQRVEIKTTTGNSRIHNFSSHQIPGTSPEKTLVVSVMLEKVEVGVSLHDLFNELKVSLSETEVEKLFEVSLKTLGIPITLMNEPQIDLNSALANLKAFNANDVPRPTLPVEVLSCEWASNLDNSIAVEVPRIL